MIKRIYLLLMLFGGCLFSMRAAVKEEIYVNHIADTVEIGNEFLARKFLVKNDKVRTCMIENKRMGKEVSRIIPETISEDFIIRTLSADSVVADITSLWGNRCTYRACSSDLNFRLRRRRLRVIGKYVSAIIRERALRCLLRKAVWRTAGRLPPGKK